MKATNIIEILDATRLTSGDAEVTTAYCADLMSDVLKKSFFDGLLLTGLANIHSLRTAEMLGIPVILYVRDKMPTEDIIAEAESEHIILLKTKMSMFETCGILYTNGILPTE